ncbi:MAG: glyoxylate/hydroxypyruvate reductase A [Burkholderiaceae bacterium]|nr:MAG: glyoxylate/hydroxypyruvate reductase A [Burkholderiaceae bacterium]MBE7425739.1 glyoxylate/hydroxypyruvate reductase A [Ideonella sp.]MCC7288615.1 glyoxylate/hydroxypyruvate reductase A [Burkholderiaceae bacterium]
MNLLLAGDFDVAERDRWYGALAQAMPQHHLAVADELFDRTRVEVAIVANPQPGSLRGLPKLRLIQSLWAGVEGLLSDDSVPASVPIARMVDPALATAMGETALWAVLSLHRGFYAYARQQRQIRWRQLPQLRADELPITVLGLGTMGCACVHALAPHGYRITAWSRSDAPRDLPSGVAHIHGNDALFECLRGSSIVINLLPLTAATRGLLDARFFAAMPRGAALVNLARGAHVVEADLRAALATGRLGHAVLDVFEREPLDEKHPFWRHPRVTVLPHAAALTDPRSAAQLVAANVQALLDGQPIVNLIDRARGY